MKKTIYIALVALALASSASFAQTVSFSGTALVSSNSLANPLSLANGQRGIFINNDNLSLWTAFNGTGKIGSGLSLTASATYTPIGTTDAYTFIGSNNVTGSTTFALSGIISSVSLSGGVSTLDQYAVVVFQSSTSTTIAGDSYRIWRASDWLIPASGASIGYSTAPNASAYQQVNNASYLVATGTVVPEPSTYALLAMSGIGLAGYVIRRRRRA